MTMKIVLVALLVVCCAYVTSARRRTFIRPEHPRITEWRKCIESNIPAEKRSAYEECYNTTNALGRTRIREGLKCVLDGYGLIKDGKVDLTAVKDQAAKLDGKIGKAFTDCPLDDENADVDKAAKCIFNEFKAGCHQHTTTSEAPITPPSVTPQDLHLDATSRR